MMSPPRFWDPDAGGRDRLPFLQALAGGLSALYAAGARAALARAKPIKAQVPVICIGNVTVGGVGKTPVVRALRQHLRARGVAAAVLTRGYGGRLTGPIRVDGDRHTARDVGDEPLLHARDGLTIVARDRVAGAAAACTAGGQAILMDDGFQNHALAKNLSVLVFDGVTGLMNGKVFPAGPLREPLAQALGRAHGAIVMWPGPGAHARPSFLAGFDGPIINGWLEPAGVAPTGPLVAFAGLGRPEKFFDSLKRVGAQIEDVAAFPDHHPYAPADMKLLRLLATERRAKLITTEKDFMRLPPEFRAEVEPFPVAARFADMAALDRLVDQTLTAAASPAP